MIIIKNDSEQKLVKFIETIKNKISGLRAVQYKLKNALDESEKDKLSRLISQIINSEESKLFFCNDGDFFIISDSLSKGNLEKLNLHIKTFLNLNNEEIEINFYELAKDYFSFSKICDDKLRNILALKKDNNDDQKKQNNAKKHDSIINMEIAQHLIDNLQNARKNRSKPEILIVEDDLFSRKLVISSLSKEYNVMGAKDGKDAILQYSLHAPDIMFLDIELPDVTGHEVLKKILSFDPCAFIVMLSGKGDKENILNAVNSGAKGFVRKPFTKEKLLQYIEKANTNICEV